MIFPCKFYKTAHIKLSGNNFYLIKNGLIILKTKAIIGKNGFTYNKKEGDLKTPIGTFPLNFSFGLNDKPQTNYDYIKADENFYFVDDVNSRYYNMLVDIRKVKNDWKSAEKISDYKKEYAYAVNINSNPNCEKGKGSAILLHCKGEKNYTAGCVAIDKKEMLLCLKYLNEHSYIKIKPTN